MLSLTLSESELGKLFPFHLRLRADLSVIGTGPSLRRMFPALAADDHLFDHFQPADSRSGIRLGELVANADMLTLRDRGGAATLGGQVIARGDEFFLALNLLDVPGQPDIQSLQISDFVACDPAVSRLLLGPVHDALVAESLSVSRELGMERARVIDIMNRTGRLAGFLGHDFANFLSIIDLNARLLERGAPLDERQKRCVEAIIETASRGAVLTRQLMHLSGAKEETGLAISPDRVIKEHEALFQLVIGPQNPLSLELSAPSAVIVASEAGFVASMVNLLVNARDATAGHGGIRISTSHGRDVEALIISVRDWGSGMAENVRLRAFEPFFSTKAAGNGLGLPAVRAFVEGLKGNISIATAENIGTTVEMAIPLRLPDGAYTSGVTTQKSAATQSVLVVEDEEFALEGVVDLLSATGFTAIGVLSGEDAVERLRRSNFDVLLTDVVLGGMTGIDLARMAQAEQPGIRVIFMSGFAPDPQMIADDCPYLQKPIKPNQLIDLVGNAARTSV